jgi:hypothetical protein
VGLVEQVRDRSPSVVPVRPLRPADEAAVPYLVLAYEIGNTAWKLGLSPTSVGRLVPHSHLATAVADWLGWERDLTFDVAPAKP